MGESVAIVSTVACCTRLRALRGCAVAGCGSELWDGGCGSDWGRGRGGEGRLRAKDFAVTEGAER
jgi:hypothetical protein